METIKIDIKQLSFHSGEAVQSLLHCRTNLFISMINKPTEDEVNRKRVGIRTIGRGIGGVRGWHMEFNLVCSLFIKREDCDNLSI